MFVYLTNFKTIIYRSSDNVYIIMMCAYELQRLFMFVYRDVAVNFGGMYIQLF